MSGWYARGYLLQERQGQRCEQVDLLVRRYGQNGRPCVKLQYDFQQAAGWCNDWPSCYARSLTRLGSSSTYTPTTTYAGILNEDLAANPSFYQFSTVYWKASCCFV